MKNLIFITSVNQIELRDQVQFALYADDLLILDCWSEF